MWWNPKRRPYSGSNREQVMMIVRTRKQEAICRAFALGYGIARIQRGTPPADLAQLLDEVFRRGIVR